MQRPYTLNSKSSKDSIEDDDDFDIEARVKALALQKEMEELMYASMMGGGDDFSDIDLEGLDLEGDVNFDIDLD